jgi:cysteine-rich secretory family protein
MNAVWLGAIVAVAATFVHVEDTHAEDMAGAISRYRREHGLPSVKTDLQLTAIAKRQAEAMAASGTMDHSVAGSFSSRMSAAPATAAAENIAAGTKTWGDTFRIWQNSPGHNANLLLARADSVGVAVARNEQTQYKTFWAMVIAEKTPKSPKNPKSKERKTAAHEKAAEPRGQWGSSENPFSTVKNFVCKYLCN